MSKRTTTFYSIPGVRLKYNAQVFHENRDMGPPDGDFDFSQFDGIFSAVGMLTEEQKDYMVQCGVPEVAMGHVMFKKDPDTGLFLYKFQRKNKHNGIDWGAPLVYKKAETFQAADQAEDAQWWNHIVPWTLSSDGYIDAGSLVDIEFSLWIEPTKGNKRVVRLNRVGVVEAVQKQNDGPSGMDSDDSLPY